MPDKRTGPGAAGSKPRCGDVQFGGNERRESNGSARREQAFALARQYEDASRRNAAEALKHPGVLCLQLLAISGHYARQARLLIQTAEALA
jgi:hypothetical protein